MIDCVGARSLSKASLAAVGQVCGSPLGARRLHCHVAASRRLDATRAIAADFRRFEEFVVRLQDDIIQVMQGSVPTSPSQLSHARYCLSVCINLWSAVIVWITTNDILQGTKTDCDNRNFCAWSLVCAPDAPRRIHFEFPVTRTRHTGNLQHFSRM